MSALHDFFEWLKSMHDPTTFVEWLSTGGTILVTAVVFAETGLLLGFFLPGDSLLITTGVLSNPLNPNALTGLNIVTLNICLVLAAFVGDQLGYFLGRRTGVLIYEKPDGRFFKRKYIRQAHEFYEKYGVAAIMICKFMPIFRTFVPFIAGVAEMKYARYVLWDAVGAFVWITSLLWIGYFLGQTPLANRLDKIIVIVLIVSTMPVIISAIRAARKKDV
jgi:membrane-associated protein